MEVPLNADRLPPTGTFLARPYGYRPQGFEYGQSSEEMSLTPEREASQTGWHDYLGAQARRREEIWTSRELSREREDLPLRLPVTDQEDNTWMYLVGLLLIISFVQISSF